MKAVLIVENQLGETKFVPARIVFNNTNRPKYRTHKSSTLTRKVSLNTVNTIFASLDRLKSDELLQRRFPCPSILPLLPS